MLVCMCVYSDDILSTSYNIGKLILLLLWNDTCSGKTLFRMVLSHAAASSRRAAELHGTIQNECYLCTYPSVHVSITHNVVWNCVTLSLLY
jgi:hypothetical protein